MEARETSLPGCIELRPRVIPDDRGVFVKTFQETLFRTLGLEVSFPEHFYSRSLRGVIRGLHFQLPPRDQHKVVYCVSGRILDVVVDVRVGSPTYGRFEVFELDDRAWHGVFVPKGLAHGFAACTEAAVVAYLVSDEFEPSLDSGIRWDSVPAPWPFDDPVVSEKDRNLPPLSAFESPWQYRSDGR